MNNSIMTYSIFISDRLKGLKNLKDLRQVCGKRPNTRRPRIVGGHESIPNSWPWQVVYHFYDVKQKFYCCRSRNIFFNNNTCQLIKSKLKSI